MSGKPASCGTASFVHYTGAGVEVAATAVAAAAAPGKQKTAQHYYGKQVSIQTQTENTKRYKHQQKLRNHDAKTSLCIPTRLQEKSGGV